MASGWLNPQGASSLPEYEQLDAAERAAVDRTANPAFRGLAAGLPLLFDRSPAYLGVHGASAYFGVSSANRQRRAAASDLAAGRTTLSDEEEIRQSASPVLRSLGGQALGMGLPIAAALTLKSPSLNHHLVDAASFGGEIGSNIGLVSGDRARDRRRAEITKEAGRKGEMHRHENGQFAARPSLHGGNAYEVQGGKLYDRRTGPQDIQDAKIVDDIIERPAVKRPANFGVMTRSERAAEAAQPLHDARAAENARLDRAVAAKARAAQAAEDLRQPYTRRPEAPRSHFADEPAAPEAPRRRGVGGFMSPRWAVVGAGIGGYMHDDDRLMGAIQGGASGLIAGPTGVGAYAGYRYYKNRQRDDRRGDNNR